jgi:hypothetical protein
MNAKIINTWLCISIFSGGKGINTREFLSQLHFEDFKRGNLKNQNKEKAILSNGFSNIYSPLI